MRILITGGAGFVGASLAAAFKEDWPACEVVALDNLRRRGSELNLARLGALGVEFAHGDVRQPGDLADLKGNFDLLIEASAEPSVLAGLDGAPGYLLETNLGGALNCLEFARRRAGGFIFLSTSRVYSIAPLRQLRLIEAATRFELSADQTLPGAGSQGVAENFPTDLPRSLYGATKLAAELVIQEYAASYGLRAVINRCGVLAGPGQFGKAEQGVFTFWVARHYFDRPLRYTGFGGAGKQVRDLLHPADLYALVVKQLNQIDACAGEVFNVGGGREVSVSLCELTEVCREVTGHGPAVASEATTGAVDIPLYLSDCRRAGERFAWRPARSVREIVAEIAQWVRRHEAELRPLFT
jgi:CDP-paratose 2-epimerase